MLKNKSQTSDITYTYNLLKYIGTLGQHVNAKVDIFCKIEQNPKE